MNLKQRKQRKEKKMNKEPNEIQKELQSIKEMLLGGTDYSQDHLQNEVQNLKSVIQQQKY